jgi:hypothetical protein
MLGVQLNAAGTLSDADVLIATSVAVATLGGNLAMHYKAGGTNAGL